MGILQGILVAGFLVYRSKYFSAMNTYKLNKVLLLIGLCVINSDIQSVNYAEQLKVAYTQCAADSTNCRTFMDLFPQTGCEFISTFGYIESEIRGTSLYSSIYAPLYNDHCENYIKTYFDICERMDEDVYFEKILTLCGSLVWQSDAVNYFQYELHTRFEVKGSSFSFRLTQLLREQPVNYLRRFWYFYMIGTPDQCENGTLQERYSTLTQNLSQDSLLLELLCDSYDSVKRDICE